MNLAQRKDRLTRDIAKIEAEIVAFLTGKPAPKAGKKTAKKGAKKAAAKPAKKARRRQARQRWQEGARGPCSRRGEGREGG